MAIFDDVKDRYPYYAATAAMLEDSCYFFKNTLRTIRNIPPNYEFGERLCRDAFLLSGEDWKVYGERVRTLVDFSIEFLQLQLQLEKTGKYPFASFAEVEKHVYQDPQRALKGPWYMWALYFSMAFWETHAKVFDFFLTSFVPTGMKEGRVLEVPCGTGLFISYFLQGNPDWIGTGVDIGETSISFTKMTLGQHGLGTDRCTILNQDLFTYQPAQLFDRIMCGEFLEHVEDPLRVLKLLKSFLAPGGKIFLTAAVWASMIDHIYLYKSAEEVRVHIREAGLTIEKELVQNVFANKNPDQEKTPINYCSILTHA